MRGSLSLGVGPTNWLFVGTSRQPIRRMSYSRMIRSKRFSHHRRATKSFGRKSIATAYSPALGSLNPSSPALRRKNLSGVEIMIPAPSPESVSQPQAPRWPMFSSISSERWTIRFDGLPLMWATNPTPQESCSKRGSYKPCARGRPGGVTWKRWWGLLSERLTAVNPVLLGGAAARGGLTEKRDQRGPQRAYAGPGGVGRLNVGELSGMINSISAIVR